ncbi:MAG: DUF294 nucleotidyltransferase-like domain-containing protein, partial [Alphaproteobacteria bacterium]
MDSRIAIFRATVREVMSAAPVALELGTSCAAAIRALSAARASAAIVLDGQGGAAGIVTEQDVVRRMAFSIHADTPVERVMSAPVATIRDDEYLYRAIAFMRARGLRHLPVADGQGRVVGTLELHGALAAGLARSLTLIERLSHEHSFEGLKAIKAAQVEVASSLMSEGAAAAEIQALLSDVNLDIHRRIIALAMREMRENGQGEPPAPFALIVMGSGGRGESFLYPDQDNGFVIADHKQSERARIDGYFLALAERMTSALDAAGFPFCKGQVMATNPIWRRSLSDWRAWIGDWVRHRRDRQALMADIFFDFCGAAGEAQLVSSLRAMVMEEIASHPGFLQQMYRIEAEHGVALGLFNRLAASRRDADGREAMDLKMGGTLPLVEAVRLYALKHGIAEVSTHDRLARLGEMGVIDADELDYLRGAFAEISRLLLREQLA